MSGTNNKNQSFLKSFFRPLSFLLFLCVYFWLKRLLYTNVYKDTLGMSQFFFCTFTLFIYSYVQGTHTHRIWNEKKRKTVFVCYNLSLLGIQYDDDDDFILIMLRGVYVWVWLWEKGVCICVQQKKRI